MSFHVYLGQVVQQVAFTQLGGHVKHTETPFAGVQVMLDADARAYYRVKNEQAPKAVIIPYPLREHVECLSWWVILPACALLDGKYVEGAAEATLETDLSNVGQKIARMSSPRIDDLYLLHSLLRVGQAKPLEVWGLEVAQEEGIYVNYELKSGALKFGCPTCQAKYSISASSLKDAVVRMKCKKCSSALHIKPPTKEVSMAANQVS